MPNLLVIHHSPTRTMRALTDTVTAGANDDAITGFDVEVVAALEATAAQVLAADAVLLGTPANFGYMSGALKHFFDSTFLEIGGSLDASGGAGDSSAQAKKPYGLFVHGRYDTEGAVRSVQSIVHALPWNQAAPVLEVLGEVSDAHTDAAYELGATLAALIED